jgi:hypothetical protein
MSFSSALVSQNIVGVKREHIYSWNAASVTTGTIKTGLSVIEHVSVNNLVTADKPGKAVPTGGDVVISGVTSSDTGTILIKGY